MRTTLLALVGVLAAAPAAASPKLETVLARHFEAQGGLDRLRAVKSMRYVGTDTWDGKSSTITATRARPNLMRFESSGPEGQMVKAFDGARGWMSKAGKAELIPEDKIAGMKSKAEFDDALIDYAKRGHKVELVGVETLPGGEAFAVRLTLASGDVQTRYIDAKSFLEVKRVATFTYEGKQVTKTITFSDFRKTNGLTTAYAIDVDSDGKRGRMVINELRYDVPLEATAFAPPAGVAPAPVTRASK